MNEAFQKAGTSQVPTGNSDLKTFLREILSVFRAEGFHRVKSGSVSTSFGDEATLLFRPSNIYPAKVTMSPKSFSVSEDNGHYVVRLTDTGKYGEGSHFTQQPWYEKLGVPYDRKGFLDLVSEMAGFYLKGEMESLRFALTPLEFENADGLALRTG